VMSGTGYW